MRHPEVKTLSPILILTQRIPYDEEQSARPNSLMKYPASRMPRLTYHGQRG